MAAGSQALGVGGAGDRPRGSSRLLRQAVHDGLDQARFFEVDGVPGAVPA